MKTLLATLLLLCHYGIATHSHAQTSFFDPTFGVGGKTIINHSGIVDGIFEALTIQPDGKIVVAGVINSQATIVRFKENGSPDSTFAEYGYYSYPLIGTVLYDVVLQSDGKILAEGSIPMTERQYFTVRLNPDGTPDATFGSSGTATTDLGPFSNDYGYALALQPDGKIVIAGQTAPSNIGTIRLHPNGVLDSSFGTNGIEKSVYGNVRDIAVTPDGKILVGGHATASHGYVLMAMRYLPNGTLDTTFNHTGIVYTDAGGAGKCLLLQPDGKTLLVGSGSVPGEGSNFVVVRYNTDGSLDNTFGVGGVADVDFDSADDNAWGMYLATDGRIYVAGTTVVAESKEFALTRLLSNGGLDTDFGNAGKIVSSIRAENDYARCVTLQTDDKIVLGGMSYFVGRNNAVIARYQPHYLHEEYLNANSDQVLLLPNPTSERIKVVNNKRNNITKIWAKDITGNLIKQWSIIRSENIDISSLTQGLYFFTVQFEDGSCVIKQVQVQ